MLILVQFLPGDTDKQSLLLGLYLISQLTDLQNFVKMLVHLVEKLYIKKF